MHFRQDLRQSLRLLAKNPGFTFVAVAVLGLGIGVNTSVFSLVNALLLRPVTDVSPGRLVGIYSHDATKPDSYRAFSYPEYVELREQNDAFDELMAHNFAMVGLQEGEGTRRVFAGVVSSNYFAALGARLRQGRAFSAEEEAPAAAVPVVVVSHGLWRKLGSDPGLVGRTLRLNAIDFTVVGVTREGFSGTMALVSPELWIPFGMYDATLNDFQRSGTHQRLADRGHRNLILVGRLKDGLDAAAASARVAALSRRLADASPDLRDHVLSVSPLPRLGVSTQPHSETPVFAAGGLLLLMASLVLLIACLNLANMLLARGEARRKEIAVRLALGATRRRIVSQLLTEGLTLSLLGGVAGLLLAWWSTRLLVASLVPLAPLAIVFDAKPDANVMAAAFGFCLLATLFFGLGPALRLARADALPELKEQAGESRVGRGRRGLLAPRNLLVVGQIALSLALLTTGGLFVRGALIASEADPGFRLERGLLVEVDPALAGLEEAGGRAVYAAALERLRALPGVEAVSAASTVPFGSISIGRRVQAAGAAPAKSGEQPGVSAQYVIVASDYFKSLGLPVLRGRDFDRAEEAGAAGARPVILDEPLARKLWPDGDALGRQVQLVDRDGTPQEPLEVVGVVPGLRHDLLDPAPVPHVYVPFGGNYQSGMSLHLRLARAGGEAEMLASVRQQLRAVDARLPVLQATTLRGFRDDSLPLWLVRTGARLFTLFGAVAVLLAVVGLYGVKAYVVARRTREIGIRMALGATRASVLGLILREGAALTCVGLGLGLLLAFASGRLVSSLLYRVDPSDPLVFVLAAALLACVALAAAYLPARRATEIAPVTALRSE
jgi:predicted permease